MPSPTVDLEFQAERELGKKYVALMKQNTPRRICGLLTARGRNDEWRKAFEHIALHFNSAPPGKPAHTVFQQKYRNEEAVKDLIRQAANAPSSVSVVKLTIDASPLGRPGIMITRRFPHQVGIIDDQKCLAVIADYQGTLITAYPRTSGLS